MFDLIVANGRVIDPESGLDAVRHVGVREGVIRTVSEAALDAQLAAGGQRIDATGLVVAPGFIDLHAHGQSTISNQYQARDGVTTALELEWGYLEIDDWLAARKGKAPIHYGASAGQGFARALSMVDEEERNALREKLRVAVTTERKTLLELQAVVSSTYYSTVQPNSYGAMRAELQRGLSEGAIGIGMAHQYTPGANRAEVKDVFEFAAEIDVPIFTHVRSMTVEAMEEVIDNASETGAALHIVHVNSMSLGAIEQVLDLIRAARNRGVDVTTEVYPYTAASTRIQSSIFDEGWQQRLGISFGDIQWETTGERLTEDTFNKYRREDGVVIIHMMKDEWIERAITTPFVMIASDGMPYAPGAHPRSAGTFSRVLGRYSRDRGLIDLSTAIRKMTLMPAQRLEEIVPAMARKGRIQPGMDADITVFNPETVTDTATFEGDLSFSEGIRYVAVLGTLVVRDGETVEGVFPGEPVLGRLLEIFGA